MNSIKCDQCGFINWATAPACKRCRNPFGPAESASEADAGPDAPAPDEFEDSPGNDAPPPANICSFCRTPGVGSHCPLCRKPFFEAPRAERAERPSLLPSLTSQKKLAAAFVVVLVAVAAAFAYKSGILFKRDGKAELAEQIEAAAAFKEPVYLHLPTRGRQTPPGGEVLRERGFITLRTGMSMDSFWSTPTTNPRTNLWGLGASQSSSGGGGDSVLVGLTETGTNASVKWKQQTMGDSTQVWLVPVGGRELVEIKEVKRPPTPSGEDYLRMPPAMREYLSPKDQPALVVSFTWRWTPNELGTFFDMNSDEFKSLPLKAQQNARSCIYSDSKALRQGTATFKREGEKLVLQYVYFDDAPLAAPGGTK